MKCKVTRGIIGVAKFSVNLLSLTKFQERIVIGYGDEKKPAHFIASQATTTVLVVVPGHDLTGH